MSDEDVCRDRCDCIGCALPPIIGLGDALDLALVLSQVYGRCHAVVLTEDDGTLAGLWRFSEPHHTADTAIRMALGVTAVDTHATRAWLFSVLEAGDGALSISQPSVADLEAWRSARRRFDEVGVTLEDWLLTTGSLVRSMAETDIAETGGSETGDAA